jgi:hypothetical protein
VTGAVGPENAGLGRFAGSVMKIMSLPGVVAMLPWNATSR